MARVAWEELSVFLPDVISATEPKEMDGNVRTKPGSSICLLAGWIGSRFGLVWI